MAARNALQRKPAAVPRPVELDGLQGVVRTRGPKTTTRPAQERTDRSITKDAGTQQSCHWAHDGRTPDWARQVRASSFSSRGRRVSLELGKLQRIQAGVMVVRVALKSSRSCLRTRLRNGASPFLRLRRTAMRCWPSGAGTRMRSSISPQACRTRRPLRESSA